MRSRKRATIKLRDNGIIVQASHAADADVGDSSPLLLSRDLATNLKYFRAAFKHASDVHVRVFRIVDGREAAIIYVEGLSDSKEIDASLLSPLTRPKSPSYDGDVPRLTFDVLAQEYIHIASLEQITTTADAIRMVVVETSVLLLIDDEPVGLSFNVVGGENRSIQEPNTEAVVRGPREGFIENVSINLSMLRRRIRTASFKVESFDIGVYTKTKVVLCYVDGIVDQRVVDEVRKRLERIDTDAVIDSGYIEEFIEDNPYSPFPQVQNTERPDVVTSQLLEGKVSILVNGSPFALIVPINLWGMMQASEDYYERYMIANAIRALRFGFLFINLYLPSLYVAITTFHQEMLPTKALLSIAAAREVTPFPAIMEAFIMEITFEALREAGVRLPKTVGSTISIVGALVIGQAAVQAGIVSAPMVIVVSITGIGSFVIPRYNLAISLRMLRFPMILLAGTLGLFGIVVATLAVVIHLSSLRSVGVPYLAPVSPFAGRDMKDVFVRAPHWAMQRRPRQTGKQNPRRQTDSTRPKDRMPGRRGQQPQS
ncbi:spore germination protein [Alicyclobacillus fastidiosus]|uniref:Spore germination protein n=1 Tax=Alicyclobacillus fastidiosus TaxID=392011 RepID=A0ABV5AC57_9BACL|nr:spore germination protein [Alicyclobacillus fastidiosus]WEH11446.1 spore germination protein [Alicyclobacillus fastidiosus]